MKTRKWPSLLLAAFAILSFGACQDWGTMDPPAGNQVHPQLEKVASITFEEEAFDPTSFNYYAYEGGDIAAVEDDAEQGKALHLPDGYARTFNPLNSVKVQNGVSLTFLMKQPLLVDEETEEVLENDLEGAIFSFQNENGTQRMFLTANGWLKYEAVDGEYEANNPSTEYKTGMLENDGAWHYVAVKVRNDGYEVYVDGKKKVEKTEIRFDFSKIVQFMASTPYLYIGYGADTPTREMWIDDITIYRNQITASQIADPRKPADETDYRTYIQVGASDYSSGWWSTFSDLFKFNQSLHIGFYNYGSGNFNWNNWNLALTNGKAAGEAGYIEYFLLRSDAYGWQGGINTNDTPGLLSISQNFNWDTFISDMQGAYVSITLTRNGNRVDIKTDITTAAGTKYSLTACYDDTNYDPKLTDTLGAFLVCDGSYFMLDAEDVYTEGQSYEPGSYLVGPEDCSAGWWSAFSSNYVISGNNEYPFGFIFTNNNNNGMNWNNWLLVATKGAALGAAGYEEYFVIRSDAYGWSYTTNTADTPTLLNIAHSFNFDTFVADMKGAYVRLFLTRKDNVLDMKAKIRTATGTTLGDYTARFEEVSTPEVGVFLTAEQASLDVVRTGYFPYAGKIEK